MRVLFLMQILKKEVRQNGTERKKTDADSDQGTGR